MSSKRFRSALVFGVFILLANAGSIFAQTLPSKITLAQDCVFLQDCKYSSGATMSNLQGSGTLATKLNIAGKDYVYSLESITFSGLTANQSGTLTGGSISIPAKLMDDFLGSGLILDVKGGSLKAVTTGGKTAAQFDMKAVVTTGFNDSKGNPLKVDFQSGGLQFAVDSSGGATLIGAAGKIASGPNDGSFIAAGLRVLPASIGFTLNASKSAETAFQMTCGTGTAYSSIPRLLTMDSGELALQFTNLTVNQDGDVSVLNMGLSGGKPVEIALSNPLDFILRVTHAQVSLEASKRTDFKLLADVVLPENIKDSDGGRMALSNIPFDLVQSAVVYISMADDKSEPAVAGVGNIPYALGIAPTPAGSAVTKTKADVRFVSPGVLNAILTRSFDFQVGEFKVTASGLVIDLSREGPEDLSGMPGITSKAWQGIYINKAVVNLPKVWQTASGDPISINTGNCYIDTNGFSGDLEATSGSLAAATIGGFQANLTRLRIEVRRSSIVASDCKGTTAIPGLGTLNLAVNISDTGTSALVEEGQSLVAEKLGLVIPVFSGALRSGPDDKWALWVNGAISLDVPGYESLKGAAMAFHDLGIDDKGQFVFKTDGWLTLDNPADVDFGVFRCNISSMAFKKDQSKWMVDMNGEISLNSDLPISGTVSFEHLRVVEGPTVSIKSISVEADVQDVVKITAILEQGDQLGGGKYLMGDANLDLTFAGGSTSLGGGFQLYVGSGSCWAVAGNVTLPVGIQLGTTPLGLYGFQGGIAHNMSAKSETGDFSSVFDLNAEPDSGKWLFMAGCDVATMADPSLLYMVGRMTIGLPDFYFNMHAQAWFLTKPSQEDRQGTAPLEADMFMDPSIPMFRVGAELNLVLPSKSINIIEVSGGLEFLAKPDDVHLAIGWPYPDQAVSASVLGGVLNTRFGLLATPGSINVRAGTGFNYIVFSGSIEADFGYNILAGPADPYLWGGIWASGEVDFWVASIGASASLEGKLFRDYLWFNGTFTATIGMPWPLPDISASAGMSGTLP
ncbi:MAG: hypothetical protein NT018_10200 [Armatimonadetes bacterium]|nr:hypothetical protein [Armatimonadota bacterium]